MQTTLVWCVVNEWGIIELVGIIKVFNEVSENSVL